jgi:hypothetical protein
MASRTERAEVNHVEQARLTIAKVEALVAENQRLREQLAAMNADVVVDMREQEEPSPIFALADNHYEQLDAEEYGTYNEQEEEYEHEEGFADPIRSE